MIKIECQQGTQEWKDARLGLITASRVKDALGKGVKGGWLAGRDKYRAQLAFEIATGQASEDVYANYAMRRGTELEPAAIGCYEARQGVLVERAGLLATDDRLVGYSPDGLVDDDGLVEIKCPLGDQFAKCVDGDGAEDYRFQMLTGLLVAGRKWIDLGVYSPCRDGSEILWTKRLEADPAELATLEKDLREFRAEVDDLAAKIAKWRR